MEELSDKAKIIYATFLSLGAIGEENKTTSYNILSYIEENEELQEHELLKDIKEEDFVNIILDLNIKSINTLIASMCRKGLIGKTEPTTLKIDGVRHNLRNYFLIKKS